MPTTPINPATTRPVAITGANSGVGLEAARRLAGVGVPVIMICRSQERGQRAIDEIRRDHPGADLQLEVCDLAELQQVHALVERLRPRARGLGALVNNAGLYVARCTPTVDGYEKTIAVNHLGHVALTLGLESELREGGTRIVNVSSQGHRRSKLRRRPLDEIMRGPSDYNGVQAYCDSKLCNVLFTRELVRRWGSDITAVAVHPGVLSTAIWDRERTLLMGLIRLFGKPFMDTPETGGQAVSMLAADQKHASTTNAYFDKEQKTPPSALAMDDELAAELWELSEAAIAGLP
jgi:NAD(P)-dependent dehydrogenase (short-subunit alcohol dehydrogenase family)